MARKRNRRDIVRLSITLLHVEPKVARRMDVPLDTYLDDLHLYIQAAMGWDNDHAWDLMRDGKDKGSFGVPRIGATCSTRRFSTSSPS